MANNFSFNRDNLCSRNAYSILKKDHEEKPLQSIKTIDKLVAIFKIIVVSIGSGTLLLVGNIYVFISIYGIHEQQHIIFLLILVVISSGVCLFPPKKAGTLTYG
ncbi:MAG: hypothetical protein HWD59_06855 [Coxiellaceae bacterium]|nr:MAG: hypothetical protein HWD59_06855 [Coxiellaceae bacterium]